MAAPETALQADEARYVLITECLQNDFVLNSQCRLALPEAVVRSVLLGREPARVKASEGVRRLPAKAVAEGPLGQFLDDTIGSRAHDEESRGVLHVINIRDWHVPDENYDFERRLYGTHCEAGTWGAGYIDGLEQWLAKDQAKDAVKHAGIVSEPLLPIRQNLDIDESSCTTCRGKHFVRHDVDIDHPDFGGTGVPGTTPSRSAHASCCAPIPGRARCGSSPRRSTTTTRSARRRASMSQRSASTPT